VGGRIVSDDPELARWNQRFAGDDYHFGTEPSPLLVAYRSLLAAGRTALAVADGEGRSGVWLAEQGLDVLSIDFSAPALAKAQRLAEARNVAIRTEQASLDGWDWGAGRFDVIAAIYIQFANPALRARIFAGIRRALTPGGLLFLQGYRPEQLAYGTGGPPFIENLYTRAMLEEAFGDLEILHLREHDSVVAEGRGHAGMSALIDLVARG
jgi:SAM-dependent methyltransferase